MASTKFCRRVAFQATDVATYLILPARTRILLSASIIHLTITEAVENYQHHVLGSLSKHVLVTQLTAIASIT